MSSVAKITADDIKALILEIKMNNREADRQLAEEGRVAAEDIRVDNENLRISNESSRVMAENQRTSQESGRVSAEGIRQGQESIRQSQEGTRQDNELARELAEAQRESQEVVRQSQEANRQNNTSIAISAAQEATAAAQAIADTSIHLGEYDPSYAYVVNNEVGYEGSSWRCIQDAQGITPEEGPYWTLVALRGSDYPSFGSVNGMPAIKPEDELTLQGGTGITVTTNPATRTAIITATGESTPGAHASSHVTGGSDVIPDAVPNVASGLMSGAMADKLNKMPLPPWTWADLEG